MSVISEGSKILEKKLEGLGFTYIPLVEHWEPEGPYNIEGWETDTLRINLKVRYRMLHVTYVIKGFEFTHSDFMKATEQSKAAKYPCVYSDGDPLYAYKCLLEDFELCNDIFENDGEAAYKIMGLYKPQTGFLALSD